MCVPSKTILNLLTMWYCVDRSKNIPTYWMIRGSDMREMKGEIQKSSKMNKLVKKRREGSTDCEPTSYTCSNFDIETCH